MTTITLTPEQEQAIVGAYTAETRKLLKQAEAATAKSQAALKRRTDARVDRANQRATVWKVRYSNTRKLFLAAQAEITLLKRKLRTGDWE